MTHSSKSGFSLIELTIVIAIIGVLIGATMVGRDFINKADLADAMAEAESLTQAYNRFLERYGEPPGDFTGATDIWGARSTCPPPGASGINGTDTCDGDGDQKIDGDSATPYETFLATQHLSLATLIPGLYTGASADAADLDSGDPGVNLPTGAHEDSAFYFNYVGDSGNFYTNAAGVQYFTGRYGQVLIYGRYYEDRLPFKPALTPQEMLIWDEKADDGLPAYGRVVSYKPTWAVHSDCATTDTHATALYNTSYDAPACALIYKINP